ncbi:hypothetical protein [Anabaena azotica]|uniref:Uncharacterized protein n=1 Tax=Anabaena azotica FACHB-119 TaxID=947527 RepID=A0ABR8D2X0_9NOST|nr:hypothetical protein [Anabaena azotica]MBD2500786.1 hypothetical protein [Anabaena azotica FACHB-119]
MEPDKLIQAFTQVVRNQDYVFSPVAIAAIPELLKELDQLENQPSDLFAQAIRQWYLEYEDVRDAVLIEEREIEKVRKSKPEIQENTQENRYRVVQDELKKLQDRKTSNSQTNQP